jgi:hypothetical protein
MQMLLKRKPLLIAALVTSLIVLGLWRANNSSRATKISHEQAEENDNGLFNLMSTIGTNETLMAEIARGRRASGFDRELLARYPNFHAHLTSSLSLKPSEFGNIDQLGGRPIRPIRLFLSSLARDHAERSAAQSDYCASARSYLASVRLGFATLTIARDLFEVGGSCATMITGADGLTNVLHDLDSSCLEDVEDFLVLAWSNLPGGAGATALTPDKWRRHGDQSLKDSAEEFISFLYARDKIESGVQESVAKTKSKILQTIAVTMLHRYISLFDRNADSLSEVLEALDVDEGVVTAILDEFTLIEGTVRSSRN